MSKKDDDWNKILFKSSISDNFSSWLVDPNSSTCFKVPNKIFKELDFKPVRLIPHYFCHELPKFFKENYLELFRYESGGCVLTKTGSNRDHNSLFPVLPDCKLIQSSHFHPISPSSILFRKETKSEENFFFLSQRMGIIEHYIRSCYPNIFEIKLNHCGRIQGVVSGSIKIGNDIVDIDGALFELDHVLENSEIIIACEIKKKFSETISLHQLLLPYLSLSSIKDERKIILIYFQTPGTIIVNEASFRIFSIIPGFENGILTINKSKIEFSRQYKIKI